MKPIQKEKAKKPLEYQIEEMLKDITDNPFLIQELSALVNKERESAVRDFILWLIDNKKLIVYSDNYNEGFADGTKRHLYLYETYLNTTEEEE